MTSKDNSDHKIPGAFTVDITGPVRPHVDRSTERSRERTPAQRRLLLSLVVLVIVVIALVVSLVVVVLRYEHTEVFNRICETEECIRSADNLIQSMDANVNPCQDFYKFACGRWGEDHPNNDDSYTNNWFMEVTAIINQQITDFLMKNESKEDPLPTNQARQLYRSCMDIELLDDLGLAPMMAALAAVGVDRPLVHPEDSTGNASLSMVLARAQKTLALDVLVGFTVEPMPSNRSVNRLVIGPPASDPVLPGYPEVVSGSQLHHRRVREVREATEEAPELEFVVQVMEAVYWWNRTEVPSDTEDIKQAAQKIIDLQVQLEKLLIGRRMLTKIEEPEDMTVDELQQLLGSTPGSLLINWRDFIHTIFEDVDNITLDLKGQDTILVADSQYLKSLNTLLSTTDKRTLYNYVWWRTVSLLSPYTNTAMRLAKERYLEEASETFTPAARAHFCADGVNELMGLAVSRFFYEPTTLNSTRNQVMDMLQDIRWAFNSLVNNLDWMDDATKQVTRDKAAAMKFFIGFPDWISDKKSLEDYYKGVITSDKTFLSNMLSVIQTDIYRSLARLRVANERTGWDFSTPPLEPNAAHLPYQNVVLVQAGILQFPYYDLGLEALNYGALGSILGHELTHGFDDQGRKYDLDGNRRPWWTKETINEYVNRTTCFVKQYSSYSAPEINATVDGELTLGENIADNGGIREALRAYRKFRERSGVEKKLPGMEKYSDEQLFFLSYANVWCEKWSGKTLRNDLLDEHTPSRFRVPGTLSNSIEFAQTWNCDKGSPMNPDREKCILW